jgi:hypothetical protein
MGIELGDHSRRGAVDQSRSFDWIDVFSLDSHEDVRNASHDFIWIYFAVCRPSPVQRYTSNKEMSPAAIND